MKKNLKNKDGSKNLSDPIIKGFKYLKGKLDSKADLDRFEALESRVFKIEAELAHRR